MPSRKQAVPINPAVLVWARMSVAMSEDQAAAALKVPVETLRSWEAGAELGITELRRVASAYKRPLAALLQPEAPPLPRLPEDFRTIAGAPPSFATETLVAIRDAQRIQEIASELVDDDPAIFPPARIPQLAITDSPQESGLVERNTFGQPIEEQLRWSNANQAYNVWRNRVQLLGIITLAKPMPRNDCRGFSLYEQRRVPVVVVNSREVDQAKIFTLFHEYAHLTLNREGICLERDQVLAERWCNRFSSALLVPRDTLRSFVSAPVTSTQQVRELAQRFNVSRHVVAIRLEELGLGGQGLYDRIKDEDAARYDWPETAEPHEEAEEEFGARPQEAVRLSEVGFGYAHLILTALRSGLISSVDASDFLDVRTDKLDAIGERVEAVASRFR